MLKDGRFWCGILIGALAAWVLPKLSVPGLTTRTAA